MFEISTAINRKLPPKAPRRKKGERQPFSIAGKRIKELTRLFLVRFGPTLPNDDAGRKAAFVMLCHLAQRPDALHRMRAWLDLWCRWMSAADAQKLMARVIAKPCRFVADTLAKRFNVTDAERSRMGFTTIGAVDLSKEQRKERRKAKARSRNVRRRRSAGAKPRAEYEANSLAQTKPWEAVGMTQRTWYRAGKPSRGKGPCAA
jgi:hypothetical protein